MSTSEQTEVTDEIVARRTVGVGRVAPPWSSSPHETDRRLLTQDFDGRDRGVLAVAARVRDELAASGVAFVDTGRDAHETGVGAEAFLNAVIVQLGAPIRVFDNFPYWKPIGVDTTRPVDRSGGVGDQPLHMDFVNAEFPPT